MRKFCVFFLVIAWALPVVYAGDIKKSEKCVCESGPKDAARNCLEELRIAYFGNNRYSEFAELLKKLCPGNASRAPYLSYYAALNRYQQLKYLEEAKGWDEYFAKGNDYREVIVSETAKCIAGTFSDDPVHLYARLLIFQFHKDQQDSFVEDALLNLMNAALDYAKANGDSEPVKVAADKLLAYEEKPKAKELYKLYAQGLSRADIKDGALKNIAAGAYKENNLELAENIYDLYIERIAKAGPKDKLIAELAEIAAAFSYKDRGSFDLAYAEKIFKKMEDMAGPDAFNEELIYLRGFNLEKSKEYAQAKDIYLLLLEKYPQGRHTDEVTYKVGLIFTYILRDIKSGREYFGRLADKDARIPQSLSGLYQLGLLKAWEGDLTVAKGYYSKLIEKSEGDVTDTRQMAEERLKEIEGGLPLEHNLKTFLDISLKEEFSGLDISKVDLKAGLYLPAAGEETGIDSSVYLAASGCFNIELQYLWSGELGSAKPGVNQTGFKSAYKNPGTKMVGLVLISPSGIAGRSLDIIDVH